MTIRSLIVASALLCDAFSNGAVLPDRHVQRDTSDSQATCSGQAQGFTFTQNTEAGSYDVTCGNDYRNGDLRSVTASTFSDCLVACDGEPTCVTVAYSGVACYLKNTLTSAVPDEGVWSAKKHNSGSSGNAATPLSCVNGMSDGTTYQASKGQFKIICGQDFYGGDLTSTSTATFEACIEACAGNSQCVDIS